MFNRFFYVIAGSVCGLLAPLGWLLWRAYSVRSDWWDAWLRTEFTRHGTGYAVAAVWSVLVLAAIGYFIGWRHDELEREASQARNSNLELNELAATDGLTNLFNTRAITERLEIEMETAHTRLAPLACLLIDVDHFKRINDAHGHPAGDYVLVTVARLLRKLVRHSDAVGRLGGEEFLVVMPNSAPEISKAVAERVRATVEAEVFTFDDKKIKVTVSIGAARYPAEGLRDKEDLFRAVDEALYSAKKSGRNRVVTAWKN